MFSATGSGGLWFLGWEHEGVIHEAGNSTATTAGETALITGWDANAEKAAGELYLLVSEERKVHFAGITLMIHIHVLEVQD